MKPSTQKTALVTGATGAIGSAVCKLLASDGFAILGVARTHSDLEALRRDLPGTGHTVFALDLQDSLSLHALQEVIERTQPAIAVHAFGLRADERTAQQSVASTWRAALELYCVLPLAIDALLLPHMQANGMGAIVHVSSSAAVHARSFPAYGAAKVALNHYIKTQGRTLAPLGVTLSGIMPAAVEGGSNRWAKARDQEPDRYQRTRGEQALKRFQTPEEIAAACAFLCSENGRIFSGCILSADPQ